MASPRPTSEPRTTRETSILGKGVHFRVQLVLRMEKTGVIKETLRIATAVPAGLPRVVPPSGAVISGAAIPGGVRVSFPCYRFISDVVNRQL